MLDKCPICASPLSHDKCLKFTDHEYHKFPIFCRDIIIFGAFKVIRDIANKSTFIVKRERELSRNEKLLKKYDTLLTWKEISKELDILFAFL